MVKLLAGSGPSLRTYDGFNMINKIVEGNKCQLALQVGIFTEMATSVANMDRISHIEDIVTSRSTLPVFRTEALLYTEHVS